MYLCSDTKRYLLVELQQTIHTLGDLRLLRNRKLRWTDSAKDNVAEERSSLYLSDRKEEKTHLTRRVDTELLFFYDPAISERQQRHPKRRIESPWNQRFWPAVLVVNEDENPLLCYNYYYITICKIWQTKSPYCEFYFLVLLLIDLNCILVQ